jgi:hypothetical protein
VTGLLNSGPDAYMTATVAVTQVPSDTHRIIIGQLHYDVDRPFVTLRYDSGTVNVIADHGASCTRICARCGAVTSQ